MDSDPIIRRRLLRSLAAAALTPAFAARAANALNAPNPANPFPGAAGQVIDFGVQPAAMPFAVFTEVMKHDRLFADRLDKLGWKVKQHRFLKGGDMSEQLGAGKLGAAALGDIPTISAITRNDMLIVALAKHSSSSVVAGRYVTLAGLKGKRIGNASGSSAHYTLLEGLASVGLGEKDVELVELPVSEMPAGLESGRIDAFSAWEPAPTIALAKNSNHFVAYRGVNYSYLLISRALADARPDVAQEFVTAFARAYYWMKKNPDHLRRAAVWTLAALAEFTGKPPTLSEEQCTTITRREALDVAGLPALPRGESGPGGRMAKQFEFMKRQGSLPATVPWSAVESAFAPRYLEEALKAPGKSRVFAFGYGD